MFSYENTPILCSLNEEEFLSMILFTNLKSRDCISKSKICIIKIYKNLFIIYLNLSMMLNLLLMCLSIKIGTIQNILRIK